MPPGEKPGAPLTKDGARNDPGTAERLALGAIVVLILGLGAWACLGPEERIGFLLYDDAYYYLGVARNLAHGAGSTFDGINPTNGYHPLWCWMLVGLLRVVDDPGVAVRCAGLLWFALAAAAPLVLWWAVRPRTGPAGAVAAAALFGLQPIVALGLARPNGLETALYALLIALFIGLFERVASRPMPASWRTLAGLGIVLGLVVLARLDGGMLAVAAAILLLAHGWRRWGARATLARVAVLATVATVVAAPSLAWNAARFGSPVPVSGRLISIYAARERARLGGALSAGFLRRRAYHGLRSVPVLLARGAAADTPMEGTVRRLGDAASLLTLLGAGGLIAAAFVRRRRRGAPPADALALLTLFGLLHYSVYALWLWTAGEETYRLYYFMPEVMLVSVAAASVVGPWLDRRLRRPIPRRALAAVVLGLLALHLVDATTARPEWRNATAGRLADRYIYGWVRRTLPPDAVLGARDAGKLGFFSGRPVVNLDGLINDQHLLAAIESGREDDYIYASPIRYVLSDRPWLDGFDPRHPERPPEPRTGLGETLYRLGSRPDCRLRAVEDADGDWVVTEVVRGATGG
jgi:dolichyl-phosphate-mannose-protein mannosyltransferase